MKTFKSQVLTELYTFYIGEKPSFSVFPVKTFFCYLLSDARADMGTLYQRGTKNYFFLTIEWLGK